MQKNIEKKNVMIDASWKLQNIKKYLISIDIRYDVLEWRQKTNCKFRFEFGERATYGYFILFDLIIHYFRCHILE